MTTTSDVTKKLLIKNEADRIVVGVICEPFRLDTDSDFFSKQGIRKMYIDFVAKNMSENIDREHDNVLSGSKIVRSYIALSDDPDNFPEGAWVGECKITSDEDWDKVCKGEFNGFSAEFTTVPVSVRVATDFAISASGTTEVSLDGVLPPHTHKVKVDFDMSSGKVILCHTDETLGHSHQISRATATDEELGHSHRMILEQ